ncbi:MAG: hypothetical protein HYV63_25200 [Candidatus Schekmanbacteria bacterium]|nr:hypothetical protein [Candidatus Schekmanbacteria bacterium]
MKQGRRVAQAFAAIGAMAFLAGCGESVKSRQHGAAELDALEQRWKDSLQVAEATSRIALSGPVMSLQAIRREVPTLQTSACLKEAGKLLGESMDASIGFQEG